MIPLAISGALLAPQLHAAPKWDCRAGSDGGWECYQDGVLAPPVPVVTPSSAPLSAATSPAETVTVKPLAQPEPMLAAPLDDAEPEAADTAPSVSDSAPAVPETTDQATALQPPSQPAAQPKPAMPAVARETEEPRQPTRPVTADPQPVREQPPMATQRRAAPASRPAPESTAPAIASQAPQQTAQQPSATTLARIDQGLNWGQCLSGAPLLAPGTSSDGGDETQIEADAADLNQNDNTARFRGNVVITQGDRRFEADQADYHRDQETLDAQGGVFMEQPGLRVASEALHYDLANRQGNASNAQFRLTDRIARGSADTAELINPEQSRYDNVTYTSCAPGNSDWLLQANELELDRATGIGTARGAKLSFKGVPFIYLPYASFPIDDRRKSGFLAPKLGLSDSNGTDLAAPYYFNIAPHMDATFTPRLMSKRGLMLAGEMRYLAENFYGEVRGEILPSDSEQPANEPDRRGALNIDLTGTPAPRWRYDIDINHVSDIDYIDDLGDSLSVTSARHQQRLADLRYDADDWNFLGRLQQYQTIDRTLAKSDRPYHRLPQLLFNLHKPNRVMGLTFDLNSEFVEFDHSLETKTKGQRIDLKPAISLPMRRPWGFLTPKLSARYTSYDLDNQTAGLSSSPDRALATFSLDGGLYFERAGNWFGQAVTHTLEPRLYYLYTPKEDQTDLPDFDTSELDFSFANLFRDNRFSGADKVGDANQLTTALTSRILSAQNGTELMRASVGQISYFENREVQLQAGGTPGTDDSSSIVAEVAAQLSGNWRSRAGIQWNPHRSANATEKTALSLHYLDTKQRILNLAYRHTTGSIEQTDISGRWPITSQVHGVARWQYSLLHDQTMEAFAGIEYDSCCWTSRLVVRDYRNDASGDNNMAIFLQLELKGLTSLGERVDEFLERGILGYQTNE